YSDPLEANSVDQTQSLRELLGDIDAGKVEVLIIIGGNPAYNTPVDLRLDFNRVDKKIKLRAHLSLFNNETSQICHWHIPMAHYLESWGDARAHDGTVSIVQPLIAPLYEGKTAYEMLALFSDNYDQKPYDMVRGYWQANAPAGSVQDATLAAKIRELEAKRASLLVSYTDTWPEVKKVNDDLQALKQQASKSNGTDFESSWRKWLHDGFIPNTTLPAKTVAAKSDLGNSNAGGTPAPPANTFEIVFRPDPSIYDGRFSNNGWLQELPKPLTKITWDNVALVSPN